MEHKYLKIIYDEPRILQYFDGVEIKPNWMTKYPNAYNWIYEGWKNNKKLSEEALIKLLKKDGADDDFIYEVISYDKSDLDADFIINEFKQELLLKATEDIFNKAYDGKITSIDEILSIYNKNVPSLENEKEKEITINGISDIASTLDSVFTDEAHISSGWDNIDCLSGGWYIGDTHCIVAGSGIGKSIILANIARRSIENGLSVLYITTEMSGEQQLKRIYKSFFKARDKEEIKSKLLLYKNASFPLAMIKIHPNSSTTLDIKKIAENKKFDILIIDYMDELRATEKTKDEYEKHRILGTDLKKLAEELNVPLITASQTNRSTMEGGATKSYVGIESIGDSWNKVKALSFVYTVIQTEDMKQENGLCGYTLSLQKSRYSGKGNVHFTIDYSTMRMEPARDVNDIRILMANKTNSKKDKKFQTSLQGNILKYFNNIKDLDDLAIIKEVKELYKEKAITSKEKTLLMGEIDKYRNILEDYND